MDKTVVLPGMWGEVDSEKIDELQMSYAVVTHRPGYRKVVFSGAGHPDGDVAEQTRAVLATRRDALRDLGGSMDDVTAMRVFVVDDPSTPRPRSGSTRSAPSSSTRPTTPPPPWSGFRSSSTTGCW